MTEFGAEATEPGPDDIKQTYAFQSRLHQGATSTSSTASASWAARSTGPRASSPSSRDWDGGAHPLVRDSIHNKALIAYDGEPKPAFDVARDAFKATPLYRDDPAAVVRAELSESTSIVTRSLLIIVVLGGIAALLFLDAICLRDIWRNRPRDAEVVELRRRSAA